MSDLKPRGIPIELGGVERHFLFTLNVIDEIESRYDMPILDVFGKITDESQVKDLRYLVAALINDELERGGKEERVTEREAGGMVDAFNRGEVVVKILAAYNISMPDPEEDEEEELDPNE